MENLSKPTCRFRSFAKRSGRPLGVPRSRLHKRTQLGGAAESCPEYSKDLVSHELTKRSQMPSINAALFLGAIRRGSENRRNKPIRGRSVGLHHRRARSRAGSHPSGTPVAMRRATGCAGHLLSQAREGKLQSFATRDENAKTNRCEASPSSVLSPRRTS
jgi:hypothetical protein